jgi:hypothetical protein
MMHESDVVVKVNTKQQVDLFGNIKIIYKK